MEQQRDEQFVRGLILNLHGQFDAMAMMRALSLRPIRVESAGANQVCDIASGQALMFTPKVRVEHDRYTGSTTATPDEMAPIAQHFDVLFHAIDALPPDQKQAWDGLQTRTIDLDLLWTNEPSGGTLYEIPEPLIARLAAAKLTLRVSVFASRQAVELAISQLQGGTTPS